MKHKDMVALMGTVVTVRQEMRRHWLSGDRKEWRADDCEPWAGWVVGFRYRQDGRVKRALYDSGEGGDEFTETSRQLCMMVAPWPTKKAVPVPLDGFAPGGEPIAPDHGGWRAHREMYAAEEE